MGVATNFATIQGIEARTERRDDVYYRARGAGPDGCAQQFLIVNLSAHGLMIRGDFAYAAGDRLDVTLPGIGPVIAEVRWALGGRLGCQLDRPVGPADYYMLLAAMTAAR